MSLIRMGSLPANQLKDALITRLRITDGLLELWAVRPSGGRLKLSFAVENVSQYGEDGWNTVLQIKEAR